MSAAEFKEGKGKLTLRDHSFTHRVHDLNQVTEIEVVPLSVAELFVSESQNRWIPVGERLPANAEHVLVALALYRYPYSAIRGEGHWRVEDTTWTDGEASGVTHWMPLPEAP